MLEGDTEVSRKWREEPDVYWSEKFGKSFSPRLALQLMGTEAGRNVFHTDIWVISLLNRSRGKNVVVTDVRFQNEIKYIQDNGGVIIRVKRGDEPEWYNDLLTMNTTDERQQFMSKFGIHPSEWDWVGSEFDYVIENNRTIDDLGNKVNELLQFIR
jgi:hypothetical protein